MKVIIEEHDFNKWKMEMKISFLAFSEMDSFIL